MQIVIPMAGEGRRFVEAGYKTPKPLIPISGKPMAIRAALSLPAASRYIFIVQEKHVKDHNISSALKAEIPNSIVIETPSVTMGQACSASLALPYLNLSEPVTVAACDNSHVYNQHDFEMRLCDTAFSCIVWTYRNDPRVERNPKAYGWARVLDDGISIHSISCKIPISNEPKNDHAISGCFTFRKAEFLQMAIDYIIVNSMSTNGEFYLDSAPNALKALGRQSCTFEVQQYLGWGTPEEYLTFIQSQSNNPSGHPNF